ncbi:inositol monophosphatase family protein [Kribbella catacumbae]|uniref:inositol monophosphatase family protein n=1 Tax=Kribbella catacumbae TaxID=460086 RepID=UPI0003821EBA|nr:inositol monophosphatase family protein [Kribbella catacumbae]
MDIPSLWQELEGVLTPMLADFRSKRSFWVEQKPDSTLLSEADGAVQEQIIKCVRAVDPDGLIIGEEGVHGAEVLHGSGPSDRLWIIDPIDGTAQFVDQNGREFCSVVCLVENKVPVAAFVLAPEIGPDRGPVCISLSGRNEPILVNGRRASGPSLSGQRQLASVTRSSGTSARPYESELSAYGYQLKVRATSQTLDMVRTCIDIAPFTDPALESFGLFYRERQKVWDGAAGICMAYAAGLYVGDGAGRERTAIDIALDAAEPIFDSTLVASDAAAAQIVVEGSKR